MPEDYIKKLEKQTQADIAAANAAIQEQQNQPLNQPSVRTTMPSVGGAEEGTTILNNATNAAQASNSKSQTTGLSAHSQTGNSTTTSQVGALTPEQQAELDQRIAAYNQGQNMRINPETGQYEYIDPSKTTLGSVLPGLRNNAEEAERINYNRSLGSALYNSLQALSDMGIAIGGGNVHQRELDKTGIEAAKDTQARKDKLAEQEAAAKQRDADLLRAAADNAEKLRERFDAMRERVSRTTSDSTGVSTNNQVTNSQQKSTSKQRSEQTQQLRGKGGYGGYGSGSGSGDGNPQVTVRFRVKGKNGEQDHYESVGIPTDNETYKRLGDYMSSVYNELINTHGKTKVENILSDAGINKKDDGTYDPNDLLRSGIIFDNPTVRAEFEKIIRNANNLTQEQKDALLQDMQTYSTITDTEKRGWFERIMNRLGWYRDPNETKQTDGTNGASTFGTVPTNSNGEEIDEEFSFITQPQINEP